MAWNCPQFKSHKVWNVFSANFILSATTSRSITDHLQLTAVEEMDVVTRVIKLQVSVVWQWML